MSPQPHFGVMVPQFKRTWEESCRAATEFEAMGYDSLWVNDHLYGATSPQTPVLEAWSLLAGLAAVTTRVELGTLVTPTAMRNPAHLGKTIATVDSISGGRVIQVSAPVGWSASSPISACHFHLSVRDCAISASRSSFFKLCGAGNR